MNIFHMWRNSNRLGKYDAHFLMKVADLLEVGFTLKQALVFLIEQYDVLKPQQQDEYLDMVNSGSSLSSILKAMGYRDAIVIQVSFAEIHGEVLANLRDSSAYLKNVRQTTAKLVKSLQYPMLLVAIFLTILITLNFTVIPQFKSLYSAMGTSSEGIVKMLIMALEALPLAILIFVFAVMLAGSIILYLLNMKDIERKSKVLARLPSIGFFFIGYQTYRFSREFGYFLNNGLEVKEILDLFIHQEINPYLRHISRRIETKLLAGDSLSQALAHIELLDSKLSIFVNHGEQNSSVGNELIMFSEYTLERLIMRIENVTRKVQPVIFVILGVLIICLYLIIVLPIFQMMSSIN